MQVIRGPTRGTRTYARAYVAGRAGAVVVVVVWRQVCFVLGRCSCSCVVVRRRSVLFSVDGLGVVAIVVAVVRLRHALNYSIV